MSTKKELWVKDDGSLSDSPLFGAASPSLPELVSGLQRYAKTFSPSEVDDISIYIEPWEGEICTRWSYRQTAMSYAGGYAYRYSYDGEWSPWSVHVSYGYSDATKPLANPMTGGTSMKIKKFGVRFEFEITLLGLCGLTRGPVRKLQALIPLEHQVINPNTVNMRREILLNKTVVLS